MPSKLWEFPIYGKKEYWEGRFQMWLNPECFILSEFFIMGYKGKLVMIRHEARNAVWEEGWNFTVMCLMSFLSQCLINWEINIQAFQMIQFT